MGPSCSVVLQNAVVRVLVAKEGMIYRRVCLLIILSLQCVIELDFFEVCFKPFAFSLSVLN